MWCPKGTNPGPLLFLLHFNCSHGASTLLFCLRVFSPLFSGFSITPCVFIIQINSINNFQLRNISQFRVHTFHLLFLLFDLASSAVSFLVAVVIAFQTSQSLHKACKFPSFFPSFICIQFWFPARYIKLFMCLRFQLIASKSVKFLDVWASTTLIT